MDINKIVMSRLYIIIPRATRKGSVQGIYSKDQFKQDKTFKRVPNNRRRKQEKETGNKQKRIY